MTDRYFMYAANYWQELESQRFHRYMRNTLRNKSTASFVRITSPPEKAASQKTGTIKVSGNWGALHIGDYIIFQTHTSNPDWRKHIHEWAEKRNIKII